MLFFGRHWLQRCWKDASSVNYWVLDRIICLYGFRWCLLKHDAGLPFPLGICVHRRKNNELGWEWPVTEINGVRYPDVCLQCPAVLRYSAIVSRLWENLGCLPPHPSPNLWLVEMEIKAVLCWFKQCHSRFLPLKCFNNMKSLHLLLKMMMDISEQQFWGPLNFSNVHNSTAELARLWGTWSHLSGEMRTVRPPSSPWLGLTFILAFRKMETCSRNAFQLLCVLGILCGHFRIFECAIVWVIHSHNE